MWLGLELALMGMSSVFVFLISLIIITLLMSRIVRYFEQEQASVLQARQVSEDPLNARVSDETLTKIIQTAIQQHRLNK